MTNRETVSVVGLGRIGLPMATALASRGYRVLGVDMNETVVRAVNALPLEHVYATANYAVTRESDVIIVIVSTPPDASGVVSSVHVAEACRCLAAALDGKKGHLIIVSSTLMPGIMDSEIQPILSGHALCYVFENVALGSAGQGFLEPDFLTIGSSDEKSAVLARSFYSKLCLNVPTFYTTNFINAEIIKLALNNLLTLKITFANELANLCGMMPDADVDVVTGAIGLDPRISPRFLTGGAPFGGYCFPRDATAMSTWAAGLGAEFELAETVRRLNQRHADKLARLALDGVERGGIIGVLGLTYKPDYPSTEAAFGTELAEIVRASGHEVVVYDPLVTHPDMVASAQDCVDAADVVVITLPYCSFKSLLFRKGQTVIDCWRILNRADVVEAMGARYIGIGMGPR